MNQKICDIYDRIILIFTNIHIYYCTILLHDHTMNRQWKCYPLIFLHPAVIMGIQIYQIRIFI